MASIKFYCPNCGAPHEWKSGLPEVVICGNCESKFSPANELKHYTVNIVDPDNTERVLEVYSGPRPLMIPRVGDEVVSRFLKLSANEGLVVRRIAHEFKQTGALTHQIIHVFTEIREDQVFEDDKYFSR